MRRTKYLTMIALLGSMAIVFEVLPLDIPYPPLPRVTYDPAGIPATLATMMYNVYAGIIVQLLGCLGILAHGNWIGALFKGCAEISTIIPLYIVVKYWNIASLKGRAGIFTIPPVSRALVMALMNYYTLPPLIGMPEHIARTLVIPLMVFNITQALINIGISYLIYLRIKGR